MTHKLLLYETYYRFGMCRVELFKNAETALSRAKESGSFYKLFRII